MASSSDDHMNPMTKSSLQERGTCASLTGGCGHQMAADDPDNPQNFPFTKKLYVSLVATFFTFSLYVALILCKLTYVHAPPLLLLTLCRLFSLTSYAQAIPGVMQEFHISMTYAIAPFSLYLVGIAFAPIYTPHLSEKFGRAPVYLVTSFTSALFMVGASRAKSIETLCATRFFAGFLGGPSVVLIEGTYADVWSPSKTLFYYSNLTWASYLGAAAGPLVTGYVVAATSWRWTQYLSLMISLAAVLLGVGMPETYPREIVRSRARRHNKPHGLAPALSGVTFSEMARHTLITPLIMLVSEPIVILFTLQVVLVFGTVFQWFITVPAVLHMVYSFTPGQIGLAFISAICAIPFAVATCGFVEAWAFPRAVARSGSKDMIDIEYRLLPAFLGGPIQVAAMFWIGWTATPTTHSYTPIIGTWFFVWGNMLVLIAYVSYIFDAYPAQGTLSALTAGAVMRVLFAAATPLFIIQMITKLGGGPTFSIWGALCAAWILITVVLFQFGAGMRARSRYSSQDEATNGMNNQEKAENHDNMASEEMSA